MRIRTIKPEFPHSESMGRVCREARLLYILLWPICDDVGRAHANPRYLAHVLFPYDDDAEQLLPGWLEELERERCIRVYTVGHSTYLQVENWSHQKIDRPSPSRIPGPDETPRALSRPPATRPLFPPGDARPVAVAGARGRGESSN